MKKIPISEIELDLSEYLRLAEQENIVIIQHGKPVGVLVGFADEDDWLNYRLKHDRPFLARIAAARYRPAGSARLNLEDLVIE